MYASYVIPMYVCTKLPTQRTTNIVSWTLALTYLSPLSMQKMRV